MPPGHFSITILQRGIIIMFMPAGAAEGPPIIPVPMPVVGVVIPIRSIIAFIIAGVLPGLSVARGPTKGPVASGPQYKEPSGRNSISHLQNMGNQL